MREKETDPRVLKYDMDKSTPVGSIELTVVEIPVNQITLLEDYSYNEIRKMNHWDLTKVLQNSWVKLYKVLDADF